MPTCDHTTIAVTIRFDRHGLDEQPERAGVAEADPERRDHQREYPDGDLRHEAGQCNADHTQHDCRDHQRARSPACRGRRAGGDDDRRAYIERTNLLLCELVGEVQRKHPFEDAKRERGEEDRGGREHEAGRAKHRPVAGEVAASGGRHEQHEWHCQEQQHEVGQERSVNATERPQRRAD